VTSHSKDIKDHTHADESDESKEKEDSEEEKPKKRQKLSRTGHGATTMKSGPVTTTILFNRLRRSKAVEKHGRMKPHTKGTGSTSPVLSDVKPCVTFTELALCLHAYLHCSKDLPLETRCQPEVFDGGVREFLRLFNACVHRGDDSVDTDTCEIHCHLHILGNMLMFGDPMQCGAAKGERGLKDWAKLISQTAQKCGIDIFLFQTIHRAATNQQRAQQLELWRKRREEISKERTETSVKETPIRKVMNRKLPHFRHNAEAKVLCSIGRKGKETEATEETGLIDRRIISKIEAKGPQ
jgi:hypothetical protein